MDILSLSYTNIWPFADQTKTVTFLAWSSLITAPIGSWKSFLFFDGPLFALYKYSSRPMLSRKSKKWCIRCIFYYESQWYLIERQIKPTKSWNDSVQSRLWTIGMDPRSLFKNHVSIQDWDHLYELVAPSLEEVEFTSWRELDEAMKALLPPRELIQSVYLLMQESDHVFELPPAQRINVFKHLFGLIGIDEAKDKLTDRRKELSTTLKLLQDTSDVESKFFKYISQFRESLDTARSLPTPSWLQEDTSLLLATPTCTDLILIDAEVTIQGFTIEETLPQSLKQLIIAYKDYQKVWYTKQAESTSLQKTIQENTTQINGFTRQIQILEDQTKKAKRSYDQLDIHIQNLQEKLPTLEQQVKTHDTIEELDLTWVDQAQKLQDLSQAVVLVQQTIQEGKDVAQQIALITQRQETILHKSQSLQEDIKSLDEQITATSHEYDQQMKFHCDKIEGSCPYVEAIKGSATKWLAQQRDILTKQKALKESQLQKLQTDAKNQQDIAQLAKLQQQKQQAWKILWILQWKLITQRREDYLNAKKSYDTALQQLQQLQTQRQSIQLPDPQTLETKRELLQHQIQDIQTWLADKQQQLILLQDEYTWWKYESTTRWITTLESIEQMLVRIEELLESSREKHERIQTTKDELSRNKELTTIFSKELMVVALQDFLPNLESVINTFLDGVVDYQIRFLTPESVSDTLELDIEIHDHRGVRQVKSLSWWQRATLKIAWILAVSSLFNGQFLFLDETITSLDGEAVARIGRLLESYMKKRETKLLLVTHASQIQGMEMWDRIVNL